MDVYEKLREAIEQRKQVVATYGGQVREFCPHVLGIKGVERHVLAFQFGGSSTGSLPPSGEWRCFRVDGLSDVTLRDGHWHSRTDLNVWIDTCIDVIDVYV
jgi:hypothetical protein